MITVCLKCLNVHLLELHTWVVYTFLKLTCMLLMSVYTTRLSIAMSVLSGSAKFIILVGWKNPSTPSQFFLSASFYFFSQWKLKACGPS